MFSCSPDYTLSRITSNLRLTTPTGLQMDFPLMATLPHNLLVSCYSSLPRSELEALASYVSVPLWLLALLVMIVATILQVNTINTINTMYTVKRVYSTIEYTVKLVTYGLHVHVFAVYPAYTGLHREVVSLYNVTCL